MREFNVEFAKEGGQADVPHSPTRAGKLNDFPSIKALHDAEENLGRMRFHIVQAIDFGIIIFLEGLEVMLVGTKQAGPVPFL